ncbi:MAG: hypothetical protein ABF920_08030 [Lacticaseibacillus paracasei]|uniref:hypothetical protein n=1 Tax=Lacticaseibacillus paracasei TaxID=1597 RepID=UPI00186AAD4A
MENIRLFIMNNIAFHLLRDFAFIKSKLGLHLVNNRTAEAITASIDTAVVAANLERLLSTFVEPISLTAAWGGVQQIDYQSTLMKQNIEC